MCNNENERKIVKQQKEEKNRERKKGTKNKNKTC